MIYALQLFLQDFANLGLSFVIWDASILTCFMKNGMTSLFDIIYRGRLLLFCGENQIASCSCYNIVKA